MNVRQFEALVTCLVLNASVWTAEAAKSDADTNAPAPLTPKGSLRLGRFERAGEYVKDFFAIKAGGWYHLFYNVGAADGKQNWMSPGNEESFGHATSQDLRTWKYHGRVMQVQGNGWEGKTVSDCALTAVWLCGEIRRPACPRFLAAQPVQFPESNPAPWCTLTTSMAC